LRAEANLEDFDLSSGFDELLSGLAEISSTTAGSVAEDQITALEIGEMRNCAVLFADIKGFTALSEKLRAEEVKLIIDHTFKILTQEIKRFNGLVDKYIGDCVMAVFGSEVSGENDSEMAVRAGLAMLDRIRQINTLMKAKGIELGMRIGVNYGEVVYGTVGEGREKDTTVMGDTVNTAQRMESNAPVNSLLITGGTRKYLGKIFIYEEKEPILVKNKVDPVPVAIVTGVNHAIRERWHRTYVTGRTKFVGRGDEMNALLSAVKDAKSGEGVCKAFIIEGPPGIGKSRLVYELRRRLRDDFGQEKTVLTSANPSYGTRAFFSIIDALRQYFEISEADSQEEAKDKFEAGFERLAAGMKEPDRIKNALPIVGSMYGFGYEDERLKLDAASLEAERRIAIKTLFEAIAEKCAEDYGFPLVMIVDDIQWSDDGSHSALMLIAREVKAKMPVVIVQLCRSDFDLPEEIASFDGLSRIELGPLSSHQFREIIESMLPGLNVPKRLLSQILERSQGNPFFLEEIVSLFIDRGIFKADDDVWRIAAKIEHLAIPASVNSIILARIDRLDRELKELLQKASVAGMEVPFPVLDFVLKRTTHGYGGGETANLLSALMGRQMLFKSGKGGDTEKETVYVFKNALIQEVAYGTLLRTNRRILHKITAEAIETGFADRLDGYLHILGMHFENAEDFAKAADYFERAGKNFAGMSRFAEAKKMFSSALASLARMHESDSRTENEIGITLALLDCCNSLGLYREGKEAAEKLFHIIEKHGGKSDLARIHRVLGVFAANLGEIETGLEQQDKARELFEELGDEKSLGRILLTLGLIAFRRSDWAEAEKRLTEALDASRKVGDRVLEASVYLSTGRLKMNLGRLPDAEAAYKTALEIAENIGDRLAKARAISNIGIIAAMLGKYAEARECYTGGLEITREIGSQAEEANLLLNLGLVCFEQGELDAALDYGREAHAMYREMGSGEMEGIALGNMGLAYEHTGDINNAIECAKASLELARSAQNGPEIGLRETYAAKYDVLAGDAGRLGELKNALERLESIGIAEYSAEGRLNYAQALASTEQYHEAETVLKSVIAMGGEGALAGIERIARRILDSMGEK
jgi:adenylate cyclase